MWPLVDDVEVPAVDAPGLQRLDDVGAVLLAAVVRADRRRRFGFSQLGKSVSNQLRPSVQTRR